MPWTIQDPSDGPAEARPFVADVNAVVDQGIALHPEAKAKLADCGRKLCTPFQQRVWLGLDEQGRVYVHDKLAAWLSRLEAGEVYLPHPNAVLPSSSRRKEKNRQRALNARRTDQGRVAEEASVDPPWNDFTAALDHVIDDGLSQEHNTARRDEIRVLRDSATGGAARNQYVLKVGETGRAFAFGNLERLRKVLARRDGPQLPAWQELFLSTQRPFTGNNKQATQVLGQLRVTQRNREGRRPRQHSTEDSRQSAHGSRRELHHDLSDQDVSEAGDAHAHPRTYDQFFASRTPPVPAPAQQHLSQRPGASEEHSPTAPQYRLVPADGCVDPRALELAPSRRSSHSSGDDNPLLQDWRSPSPMPCEFEPRARESALGRQVLRRAGGDSERRAGGDSERRAGGDWERRAGWQAW